MKKKIINKEFDENIEEFNDLDSEIKETEDDNVVEDFEITDEDVKKADEIVEEILADDGLEPVKSKIPYMTETDIFNVEEGKKLTAFVDGYLITIDDVDARLLNKLTGNERKEFLDNIKAKSNEKLIYKVASNILRFEPNTIVNIDADELYAAGWHALAKAIKTFDPSKKLLFTTYSYRIIFNEMVQEVKRVKKKVKHTYEDGVVESLVVSISMDSPIKNDNSGNSIYVSDTIADKADGPDKIIDKDDLKVTIMQALDMLDPTEKFVMMYRFGLDRDIKLTQKEIADKLNQSQANISKIEKTCRTKLRILLQGKIDGGDLGD